MSTTVLCILSLNFHLHNMYLMNDKQDQNLSTLQHDLMSNLENDRKVAIINSSKRQKLDKKVLIEFSFSYVAGRI